MDGAEYSRRGFEVGPDNGLKKHENRGLGFGICVVLGFGLEMCCCGWDFGAGGGTLMCMVLCSLVLLYLLPWASMM